jgi:hypothetical protein
MDRVDQPARQIFAQEAARIVARNTERGLRQIVGAEAEELRRLGNSFAIKAARGSSIIVADHVVRLLSALFLNGFGDGGDAIAQESRARS